MDDILKQIKNYAAKSKEATTQERRSIFYQYKLGKDNKANVVIRLMPNVEEGKLPFLKVMKHRFSNGSGDYMNHLCFNMKGESCPLCGLKKLSWSEREKGNEELSKKIYSLARQKINYVANFLVIKDKEQPENEGKIFPFIIQGNLFEEEIIAAMAGDDELAIEPIPLYSLGKDGANIQLSIKKEKWMNYGIKILKESKVSIDAEEIGNMKPLTELVNFVYQEPAEVLAEAKKMLGINEKPKILNEDKGSEGNIDFE